MLKVNLQKDGIVACPFRPVWAISRSRDKHVALYLLDDEICPEPSVEHRWSAEVVTAATLGATIATLARNCDVAHRSWAAFQAVASAKRLQ